MAEPQALWVVRPGQKQSECGESRPTCQLRLRRLPPEHTVKSSRLAQSLRRASESLHSSADLGGVFVVSAALGRAA